MTGRPAVPLAIRFAEKFSRGPADECWRWQSAHDGTGYGLIKRKDGAQLKAHRVAYELATGAPIPPGMMVCHRCDVRDCVNPAHLFLGTGLDNMRDMVCKGRAARLKGERNAASKLTAAQVLEIREAQGAQRLIAARYGVTQTAISGIRRGVRWAHIGAAP